jgi:acetyl esterase
MKSPLDIFETLKEQIEGVRPQLDKLRPEKISVKALHQAMRRLTRQFDEAGPVMKQVTDIALKGPAGDISARLYCPHGAMSAGGPTLVYFHGGGWVTGSIASHEGLCLRIASGAALRVLSVDYRLAPEHPFPAAIDDCEAALLWALEGGGAEYGINPKRIAIGGDSAGGNMTAYLAQAYRKRLKAQILFYPVMQMLELKPQNPGPQDRLQLGFIALKFIEEHYLAGADKTSAKVSPLFEDDLQGLPPAYVLTAGLDPLRKEGRAYADKLRAAGTRVDYYHEKAMPHGFLNFARAFPSAKRVSIDVAEFLRANI